MKKIVLIFSFIAAVNLSFSQSNDCSTATTLTPGAACVNTSGTTTGATQSIPGCVGTADDDVWYQFTATATSHQVTVTPSVSFDPVVQLFSGTCAALTTISCMDNGLTGEAETIYATGLTAGQVYKVRVYHYYAGAPATPTFSICVTNPPPVPSNNDCAGATTLSVNVACSATAGTSVGATQSTIGCAGTADDDVWYKFVATNAVQTITVDPSVTMDPVVELYSGSCAGLTSLTCMDNGFTDGNEVINAVGLTPGTTYYVRVYDYYSSTGGAPFTICVTGSATSAPVNDEPCNAIQWPTVTTECEFLPFTTTGATTTASPGAPSSCAGGSAPQQGGYAAGTKDVWFKVTVPSTGNLTITIQPGLASPMNDMVFALYSGACGSLSQIACSDDYNYPGSGNDLQPFLNQTGLTVGSTVYLRVFRYGTTNFGNFGLCISTNTNDACANALYICDLNGYSASTSAAFTPDRPGTGAGQMYGNNETAAGVNQVDGTNTNGPFGYYPPTNIAGPYSSPLIDVNIENNSWIRFTAGATTAVLNVTVGDCFVGGYPSGGIQMQIFSATACNNFSPKSQFKENSTGFTITATGLTVGSDYYLMVDGYANDVCNYTISANSGVQFPDIVASANPICSGASTTLTAPNGSSSYEWYPGGETTQAITVSPSTTTTYTCFVAGVCGQRQSLTKTITVNQLPTMTSSSTPAAICSGTSVGLILTSNIPGTYSWIAADNTDVTGESTSAQSGSTITNTLTVTSLTNEDVIYTVTPTSNAANGSCAGPAQTVTVTVKPKPTLTASASQSVCGGSAIATTTFTTSPTATVNWTNNNTGSGVNGIGITAASGSGDIAGYTSPAVTTTQTATITATPTLNSCAGTAQTFTITVRPTPQFTSAVGNQSVCGGANTSAISFAYSPSAGGSIAWTNTNNNAGITGVGLTSASGTGNIGSFATPLVTATQTTTITATPTIGTCSGTAQSFTITVNPTPVLSDPSDANVCGGASVAAINFSSSPVATVNWINSNSSAGVNGIGLTSAIGSGNIASYTSPLVTSVQTGTIVATPVLNSCTGSSQTFTITVNPTPVISAVTNTTVCGNSSVAAVNFTASPTTSVTWTSSSTATGLSVASGTGGTPSFTAANVTSVTTSTITLNASLNSCPSNALPYTITVNPLPQLTGAPTVTQSACGLSTGALNNIAVTGTGALTYVWTNSSNAVVGGNSNSITNQPAGSYNVTVTDNFSCPVTFGPFTISNPGAPAVPTVSAIDNVLCVGESLSLSGSSSAASPTYVWSGPNASSATNTLSIGSVTLADAGTYTLTVTESNCTSSNTINITVNANPTASATSGSAAYCSGSTINLFGSGGTGFAWTGPNSFSDASQNPSIPTSTTAASGTYSLTVTDANNCTAQSTVAVTVNQTPSDPLTTGSSNAVCEGETINLFASSTNATSYAWVGPNVFVSVNQNPTIANATTANGGVYTVIASGVGSCNSNPVLVNVIVNPNPNATLGVSANPLCSGQNVTLTASGATTIVWDYLNTNGGTLQLNNVQTSNSGYYPVEITDANGCSDRDSLLLTVNQTPTQPLLALAADTVLCEGEDLALSVTSTGATNFAWTGPNGFTSTTANAAINNVLNVNGGVYSVTASTAFCSSVVRDVTVVVNDTATAYASAAANVICSGNTISLIGVGGTGAAWIGPNGFTSTNANETITNAPITATGTYIYTSINNPGNCADTASVFVQVNETPTLTPIQANDDTLCEGEDLVLTSSSTNGSIFSWTGPSGFTSGSASTQISDVVNFNGGIYTVSVSNGFCTSNAATITIVVNDTATAYASSSTLVLCSGNNISLTAQGGNAYAWSGPNGFASTNQNETINNASALASGTYTYTALSTPGNCTDTATVTILVNQTPAAASVAGASTCTGANLNLTANATGTVNWYADSTLTTLVSSGTTYSPAMAANTVDTFYVVSTSNGCVSSVQPVIASNYNIVAAIAASPDSGSVPLPVVFTNNSIGVDASDTYQWSFNSTTFATTQNAAYQFEQGGLFNVMMVTTDNQSGCKDTAYVTIFVDDEIRVIIPNIFTPNGDGTNDVFTLDIKGAKEAHGIIYNRWGSLLHEWDAINTVWDGKLTNGQAVSDGIYFYIIKIDGYNGKKLDVPGNVTIIK